MRPLHTRESAPEIAAHVREGRERMAALPAMPLRHSAVGVPAAAAASAVYVLDEACEAVSSGDVAEGMTRLGAELCTLRRHLGPERWRHYSKTTCLRHPVAALAHQGPLTSRAFTKPRGYACDAVMLDMVYEPVTLPPDVPTLAAELYRWEFDLRASASVRARRDLLAAEIDATACAVDRPRILSVACGHLREAQRSGAVAAGRVGEYIALDQDLTSLDVVHAEQAAQQELRREVVDALDVGLVVSALGLDPAVHEAVPDRVRHRQ